MFGLFKGPNFKDHPDKLRDEIIRLHGAKKLDQIVNLCNEHHQIIKANFKVWAKVPDNVRASPEKLQPYANTLILIADMFRQIGDGSLMSILQGDEANNPVTQWQGKISKAISLAEAGNLEEAKAALLLIAPELEKSVGNAGHSLLPIVYGHIGLFCFHLRDIDGAIQNTQTALALCQSNGDSEGVAAYTNTLREIMAGARTDSVMYAASNGQQTYDITNVTESAKFEGRDPRFIPEAAKEFHEQGRSFGAQGKLELALDSFKKAREAAPHWPYPVYDMAHTFLLLGRLKEALELYKQVDTLEPHGFFTTKTAIWSLELESAGKVPVGTYLSYLMLEDIQDRQARRIKAGEIWDKCPGFTPAFKEYILGISDTRKKLEMIEQALQMDLDIETRGVLLLNKASTLGGEEGMQILTQLENDSEGTLFTRASAKELIKILKK